ncbi:sulfur oxidation c-type cytochrome SoxX [Ottowia sp.]|uniref:sulfur oxidation c-type cytochrome SoxX n=1 Tax=Ottowia sp. TaxID=1898956 RepID=UPI002C7E8C33|nr:sulfur oxidation c-type cytochrome SoxX [Ottowia sp.]HRN74931.1 sulfur oxidation c-type cytochrome SoxX [Ottowia sp.]HRQ01804.1 sulfur oxidation c-type cytochrome SoxX [Ottowia sp.]
MKKHSITVAAAALLGAAALVAGCAAGGGSAAPVASSAELDALTQKIVKADFHDKGIVKVAEAFRDDETLRACNAADVAGKPLDEATAKRIEALNMKTIKWPSNGKYLGDWKEGEKIAQSGRGMTWTDKAGSVNGGNCYNCHQIDKKEISFGTIGTSLYNYGKIRGVTDPNSPAAQEMVKYTWGKIWNSKAYNACSNMPRAGHMGILTEDQVRHLVALLLDPKSPVNQ